MIVASFLSTKHRNVMEDGQTDRQHHGIYSAGIACSYADGIACSYADAL